MNFKRTAILQRTDWQYCVLIVLTISVVYGIHLFSNGFTSWDDDRYITDNPLLQNGSLIDLLTQPYDGHYHPLTMLSLKIDYSIGGLQPFFFQLHNLLIHLANGILVFFVVSALFKKKEWGLIVALFFGLATVNVESVAWMSERKNVLSTFFYLLTVLLYLKSLTRSSSRYLLLAVVTFVLGILSKVTVVSLVPTIFLIDYIATGQLLGRWKNKIPFVITALVVGMIAISAQHELEVTSLSSSFSLKEKSAMASYALTSYFWKPLIPFRISAIYPYPASGNAWALYAPYVLAPVLLCLVLWFTYKREMKVLFFGLAFFTCNSVLLLKFFDFPLGDYIMADRYDYIPMIGSGIVVLGVCEWLIASKKLQLLPLLFFTLINIPFTVKQVAVWSDDKTLFSNVLDHYPDSDIALNNRGIVMLREGDTLSAIRDFKLAYTNNPGNYEAGLNLANGLSMQQHPEQAMKTYEAIISDHSKIADGYYYMGVHLYRNNLLEQALESFKQAEQRNPDFKQVQEVIGELKKSLFEWHFNLGVQFAKQDNLKAAIPEFLKAKTYDPINKNNFENLELARKKLIDPMLYDGVQLGQAGDIDGAIEIFQKILEIDPENEGAKRNIAYAQTLRSKNNDPDPEPE